MSARIQSPSARPSRATRWPTLVDHAGLIPPGDRRRYTDDEGLS